MVKGYAVLISRDGGRSQRFSFSWASDEIVPYQEHVGVVNARSPCPYYPQVSLSLKDEKDTANYLTKKYRNHVHIFHATGSVVRIYHRLGTGFRNDLVDVDHFMITEEVE